MKKKGRMPAMQGFLRLMAEDMNEEKKPKYPIQAVSVEGRKRLNDIDAFVIEKFTFRAFLEINKAIAEELKKEFTVEEGDEKLEEKEVECLVDFLKDESNRKIIVSQIQKADTECLESSAYKDALVKAAGLAKDEREKYAVRLPSFEHEQYRTYYLPAMLDNINGIRIERLDKSSRVVNSFDFFDNGECIVNTMSEVDDIPGIQTVANAVRSLFEQVYEKENEQDKKVAM